MDRVQRYTHVQVSAEQVRTFHVERLYRKFRRRGAWRRRASRHHVTITRESLALVRRNATLDRLRPGQDGRMSAFDEARARILRRAQDQQTESEVGGIQAAIVDVVRDPSINDVSLFDRLVRRVGLGDQPQKRRMFFKRVAKLHRDQPALVERLVAEVWADSLGARNRPRFFCFVLKRRLVEDGVACCAAGKGDGDVI